MGKGEGGEGGRGSDLCGWSEQAPVLQPAFVQSTYCSKESALLTFEFNFLFPFLSLIITMWP